MLVIVLFAEEIEIGHLFVAIRVMNRYDVGFALYMHTLWTCLWKGRMLSNVFS